MGGNNRPLTRKSVWGQAIGCLAASRGTRVSSMPRPELSLQPEKQDLTAELKMTEYKQDKTLDCTGLLCPMPVVKTNKALKELQVGQILEMIATDPGSLPDIEAWARQTRHELLAAQKLEDGKFRFMIRKSH